ncbi:hypothetical protein GF325_09465 [Candidatus Bathyarchaeota archaeon]|nr:hypothetical protein [Candidatus Bathyarchaeota archaeon]
MAWRILYQIKMVEIKESVEVNLERVEAMIFKGTFDNGEYEVYIDKTREDPSKILGPTPSRMLACALLGCLTSSLLACVQKAGLEMNGITSKANFDLVKDDRGFVRIGKIHVSMKPSINSPDIEKRLLVCKKYFEKQCTVTSALKDGIDIKVDFN